MDEKETTKVKSLADDYQKRIIKLLDDIDNTKHAAVERPSNIVYVGERLHTLFVLLTKKITDPTDIEKQKEFNKQQIDNHPIVVRGFNARGFPCQQFTAIEYKRLPKYNEIIENREIHLLEIIEKLEVEATRS